MGLEVVNLPVQGMTCDNCVRTIERKLRVTPGVRKASVDLRGATATVEYDPGMTTRQSIRQTIEKLGYQVAA
jgi:copper chaperone CopZ